MIQLDFWRNRLVLFSLFILWFTPLFAEVDGEALFKSNCTACHSIGENRLIGPGLKGITEKRDRDWLIEWIRNSQEFIKSGDSEAVKLWEEWQPSVMTPFYFSDEEFDALLAYLENPPAEEVISASADVTDIGEESDNTTILLIIVLVLTGLVSVLFSVKNSLKSSLNQETQTIAETLLNEYRNFTSNNLNLAGLGFITFIILAKVGYSAMLDIGVTTNYQPKQPIEFSHKIHAGENGIDCNYCHSSARHSKTSGIPSANVCMNCHENITNGTKTGTKEIQKIYDAVGYDPDTRKYIDDYHQKPIEWIQIHNLPDLAYFNHAQHVSVGGIECQTCHGPVEDMDEVYQHAELTMGWCVECHRETEVEMADNNYYTHLHEQLKNKYGGDKFTVEQIGGLECAKCHY
ncbi:MAG: cytochrome c3 family protein [Bacteroidota bacterium]|nr:cytochrome c3 family protein [Bacteroidota bacterium]